MQIRPLFMLALTIVVIAPIYLFITNNHSHSTPVIIQNFSPTATTEQKSPDIGVPLTLKIPRINVDAAVELVGLTANGAMAAPSDFAQVAWFELGKHPGQIGSAVIAGHYGIKNGKDAVFDDLNRLQPGDTLSVTDNKGLLSMFVVQSSKTYDADADTTEIFTSQDAKSHLNLITCEGVWNKSTKSYPKRLVVFTEKQ